MIPTGDGKREMKPPAGGPAAGTDGKAADKKAGPVAGAASADSAAPPPASCKAADVESRPAGSNSGTAGDTDRSAAGVPPSEESVTWDGLREEAASIARHVAEKLRCMRADIPSATEVAEWRSIEVSIKGLVEKAKELSEAAGKELADLRDESAKLRRERDALKDALTKARADFLDYQSREAKERKRLEEYALRSYMSDLLPVFDGLDMALKDIERGASPGALAEAFRLLADNLRHVVAPRGLEPINALGTKYNPELHQASAFRPASKEAPDGIIVEELRKGYTWKGLVLRPSEVIVARDETAKGGGTGGTENGAKKAAEDRPAGTGRPGKG
ncbi:MAG: nucleotide exchange factor GrpE [Planctomycetota bacterium]|nr:nucleotide exchange factor GrpE [Planctomycetota bacterium]